MNRLRITSTSKVDIAGHAVKRWPPPQATQSPEVEAASATRLAGAFSGGGAVVGVDAASVVFTGPFAVELTDLEAPLGPVEDETC